MSKPKRVWTRGVRHTVRSVEGPDGVLIAGEDFEAAPEHQHLVDAPSATREAIDDDFVIALGTLCETGSVTITCVAMYVKGYDDPQCIVVDGRRTVRHLRVLNRDRVGAGLPAYRVRVNLIANTSPVDVFMAGRLLNRPGLPETDSQRVAYVRFLDVRDVSDAETASVLGVSESKLATYRSIGNASTTVEVLKALDDGTISLTAAANLCTQPADVQRESIKRLRNRGKPATVRDTRRAINAFGGPVPVFRIKPSSKQIASIPDGMLTPREAALVRWAVTGDESGLPLEVKSWVQESDG